MPSLHLLSQMGIEGVLEVIGGLAIFLYLTVAGAGA